MQLRRLLAGREPCEKVAKTCELATPNDHVKCHHEKNQLNTQQRKGSYPAHCGETCNQKRFQKRLTKFRFARICDDYPGKTLQNAFSKKAGG